MVINVLAPLHPGHQEKLLCLFSALPPMFMTAFTLYVMKGKPKVWLTSVAGLIPGVDATVTDDGKVVFSLDAAADPSQALSMIKATMEEDFLKARTFDWSSDDMELTPEAQERVMREVSDARSLSRNLQRITSRLSHTSRASARAGHPKKQVLVSINHLSMSFAVPAFLLSLYFWDTTILRREASETFPLKRCLDGESFCFYNSFEYSAFRWPDYHALDCEEMQRKSVASESEFFFVAPEDAKFYKCYTFTLTTRSLIGTVGDTFALFALFMAIILYFSSQMSGQGYDDEDDLRSQLRSAVVSQVMIGALVIVSLVCCTLTYGKVSDDVFMFLLPLALLLFSFVLLFIRMELLKDRLRRLTEDPGSQTEDDEEIAHARENSIVSHQSQDDQGHYRVVRQRAAHDRHDVPLMLAAAQPGSMHHSAMSHYLHQGQPGGATYHARSLAAHPGQRAA